MIDIFKINMNVILKKNLFSFSRVKPVAFAFFVVSFSCAVFNDTLLKITEITTMCSTTNIFSTKDRVKNITLVVRDGSPYMRIEDDFHFQFLSFHQNLTCKVFSVGNNYHGGNNTW